MRINQLPKMGYEKRGSFCNLVDPAKAYGEEKSYTPPGRSNQNRKGRGMCASEKKGAFVFF